MFVCNGNSGFTGTRCESVVDECMSSPCENGGTCLDRVNKYTCSCAPSFTGTNCEEDENECMSNPCENGGTCKD